jgi:iron complex transport system ATP-binding protein
MIASGEPVVDLRDVVVRIEGRRVLGPINLRMDPGERWILLGPNGSAKTTLLSVIGARRQASSGIARVLGLTFGHGDVRTLHTDIGHASHALTEMFPPSLRVIDVVLTGKRAALSPWFQRYDDDDLDRARDRLLAVGCGELVDRIFATCSQGERQRVLLARAMFADPRMLVLDEPAAGLDLPARESLIAAIELASAEREELVVVLATHHLEEIPSTASHAALLRDGRLVASGRIDATLTPEHLQACFDFDIDVERRHGRWTGFARPGLTARSGPAPER